MTVARSPRVDPAGRPLEGRRRQALQAGAIVVVWVALMAAIFRIAGDATGLCLLAIGILSWPATDVVAGRKGLVWTGSALAIVGALSVGMGLSALTSEMRHAVPSLRFAVVTGASALVMGALMLRHRLPGLVSPTVTFTIVALFFGLYGADPARLAEVEGFSARGILAAMLQSPWAVAIFVTLSGSAVLAGRWLDLNGDDFGLAAARPLHLIGIGILALVIGRWLAMLPAPADLVALVAAWLAATVWALRINRFAVMVTAQLAMAKPLFLAAGFVPAREDWLWLLPTLLIAQFLAWPRLHAAAMDRSFIRGPGGRAPRPQEWRWWRYWPYA